MAVMPDGQRLPHLQWRLGRAIGQISRRWRARLDGRMAASGLTEARWLPLLHLARWGDGLTQKELAASLGVEGPTLVRTLDWLEREALVARRPVPHDRRAKTVHLTPRARDLHRSIEQEAAAVRAEILQGIPEEDLTTCLRVLDRVAARLGAPPAPGHAPESATVEEEPLRGHRAA
jgi:MarR family transcriptional regulator, transcriptional regulator for hemolysin